MPIVVLGLVRVKALSSKKLRSNRKIGYLIVCIIGVALPGVDPVTTIIETIPLAILFEASIWLSVFFERRWATKSGSMSERLHCDRAMTWNCATKPYPITRSRSWTSSNAVGSKYTLLSAGSVVESWRKYGEGRLL